MPVQFHTIVTFVWVRVVEYVPSTRQRVLLAQVTERLKRNILTGSAMLHPVSYPAIFFFCIPPSAGENEAVLKGLFPHMSMWVTMLLCSIDLGFGIIWKKKIPWMHTCCLDQFGMYVSSSKTLSSLYYVKKYLLLQSCIGYLLHCFIVCSGWDLLLV